MSDPIYYAGGRTAALTHAIKILKENSIVFAPAPGPQVTHLLLGVPAFKPDGSLQGDTDISSMLNMLPRNITVVGGNLKAPELQNCQKIDLLADPFYLAQNAAITAYCAVREAMDRLPITLQGCPVLVIGWGRIGKCLARLLRQMGALVTVAARKEQDLATLLSLGYDVRDSCALHGYLPYRIIFNTVPAKIVSQEAICPKDCLKIDLASALGIWGDDVIWARGLPGKYAPESSGRLIAQCILRLENYQKGV